MKKSAGNAGKLIASAIETEPGRIEITTTIVDPRGKNGSKPALDALAICEAAMPLTRGHDPRYVRVNEKDGSAFVIYSTIGGPVPAGKCAEV